MKKTRSIFYGLLAAVVIGLLIYDYVTDRTIEITALSSASILLITVLAILKIW